jgi:hypothetical protein
MVQPIYKHEGSLKHKEANSRLKWVRRLAYLLDNSICIPVIGYRIGIDPIIGLIPGAGNTLGTILSLYIVLEASRIGVSRKTLLRMIYNIGFDTLIGAVPILGNIFDATWKVNVKNFALLGEYINSLKSN